MKTVKLTDRELSLITWELSQGIVGDGSSYDNRLQKLIKKLEDTK